MPQLGGNDRLSWGDSLFLYLEREGMPLHVASLSTFDGLIGLEHCRDFVESKLAMIPRYRQRVAAPPFNLGLPSWEFDAHFDVRNHVREVALKQGSEAELKDVSASILSKVMDRSRPLWDMTLLQDARHKRSAVLFRVHHCLCDGISGVALVNAIMDPAPIEHPMSKKKERFEAPPPQDALTALLDALMTTPFYLVDRLVTAQSEVLNIAQGVLAGAGSLPATDLEHILPELAEPVQRLPFNKTCFGPQQFACAQIPLADIKALKNAGEATVNDVVLTLVAMAVRRYSEMHGVRMKGRHLRIVVPVNLRNPESANELGNRISFLPISIPLGVQDPKAMLAAVHDRMLFLKTTQAAEFVGLAGSLLGMAPLPMQAVAGPTVSQLPISLCNLICTNVPGPQMPLYLLGRKMLSWYPYVPIGGEMGVNIAMLTYNGTAYFGCTGDVNAAPDLDKFEALLPASFDQLRQAIGLTSATVPKPRRRAKAKKMRIARKSPAQKGPAVEETVVPVAPEPETESAVAPTEEQTVKKAFVVSAGR